jgi:hypothetical protein
LLIEDAEVGHGLVATSFSLENEPGSTAGGMVLYAGCQALLAGVADEDFIGAVNALEPGGGIVGDMDVEVDGEDDGLCLPCSRPRPGCKSPVEPGLTMSDVARIEGNPTYASGAEAQISCAAQIEGEVV